MSVLETLKQKFKNHIIDTHQNYGDDTVILKSEAMLEVLEFLKNYEPSPFNVLLDLCGVDYMGEDPRFEVVYHLYSLEHLKRLRVRVKVAGEEPKVPSVISIWETADWYEREAFDMFGIKFDGHPNLKRLLMWEAFEGHPLRKDYPLNKRQPIPEQLDIV